MRSLSDCNELGIGKTVPTLKVVTGNTNTLIAFSNRQISVYVYIYISLGATQGVSLKTKGIM